MLEKEITIKVQHNKDGTYSHNAIFDKTLNVYCAMQALSTIQEKVSNIIYNKYPKKTKLPQKELNEFLKTITVNDLA